MFLKLVVVIFIVFEGEDVKLVSVMMRVSYFVLIYLMNYFFNLMIRCWL